MGGGLLDYNVSFVGQVIVIVISRPRSLTIEMGKRRMEAFDSLGIPNITFQTSHWSFATSPRLVYINVSTFEMHTSKFTSLKCVL